MLNAWRPGLVVWAVNLRKVFVVELTVHFKENIDWVHQFKLKKKSEDLRKQCVRNGWISCIFPIEVQCRGYIIYSTIAYLINLGFSPSNKRKYILEKDTKPCLNPEASCTGFAESNTAVYSAVLVIIIRSVCMYVCMHVYMWCVYIHICIKLDLVESEKFSA